MNVLLKLVDKAVRSKKEEDKAVIERKIVFNRLSKNIHLKQLCFAHDLICVLMDIETL